MQNYFYCFNVYRNIPLITFDVQCTNYYKNGYEFGDILLYIATYSNLNM